MNYRGSGSAKVEPIGPGCRKRIYNSYEEAQDMIRHINKTRITREIHAYKCDICGFWHLTSRAGRRG